MSSVMWLSGVLLGHSARGEEQAVNVELHQAAAARAVAAMQ